MTFDKIKELYETDKLNVSMVPYVKPLLERIDELEKEVFDLQIRSYEEAGCPE